VTASQKTLVGPDDDQRDIRTVVADPPWDCERGGDEDEIDDELPRLQGQHHPI